MIKVHKPNNIYAVLSDHDFLICKEIGEGQLRAVHSSITHARAQETIMEWGELRSIVYAIVPRKDVEWVEW